IQSLEISIGDDEVNAFDTGVNHPVNRISATSAGANNLYPCSGNWGLIDVYFDSAVIHFKTFRQCN
ncbi:hypothetical protein JG663_18270, partial [Vibrio cholerae]|uniref:hypothetical protein n=1 Tax=Vibrio cholerae TaxID=666 RepID=UPI0018F099CC